LGGFRYDRVEQGVPIQFRGDALTTELGLGVDFRLSGKFHVGAFGSWQRSTVETTRNQLPLITANTKINVLQFGVSLKYQRVR
jgi:hypothetical protein